MATLNEIVYNLRNLIKDRTDDTKLSFNQLAFIVNYLRSVLIRREVDKQKPLSTQLQQDLGCVPVELIDAAECCNITSGCKIVRTVSELPRFVESSDGPIIAYIGAVDKQEGYQIVPWSRFRWAAYSKYTKGIRLASLLNNHVYILNGTGLASVNVRGVFDDPREAARFKTCEGTPCYTDNDTYPVPGWMVKAINDMAFAGELNVYNIARQDTTNNSKSEDIQERV